MAKTPASKLLVNIVLLAIAAVITNIYVMDSEAMQRGHQKTINLYEVFDTSPQDFAQLNQTNIKRLYRDLSRKYHPDKNREEDTTDKFMSIKQAYEILSNQEKRVLYDVYGTVDFSQDDKMKDMIEQRFKNSTDREEQFKSYKTGQTNLKIFGQVAPYYFTWLSLTMLRVDRDTSYRILCGMVIVVCAFEIQVRLKYGSGSYDFLFKLMYFYYPKNFTIGDCLNLTRELFPILFQFVLIFCDFSIDAEQELTPEELAEKDERDKYMMNYHVKQKAFLENLKEVVHQPLPISKDQLDELYADYRRFDQTALQTVLGNREEDKRREETWSVLGLLKKLFGIILGLSILKSILFPYTDPENNTKLEQIKIELNQAQMNVFQNLKTDEERREELRRLQKKKIEEIKERKKQKKKEEDERVKKYFDEKVKGKKDVGEVWQNCKQDFIKWSKKKPAVVQKVAGFVERQADYYSEFHWDGTPRNKTTEGEEGAKGPDGGETNEDGVDAELEEMGLITNETKEKIEVDEAILESLFGDADDDEEEEEAEEQQEEKTETQPAHADSTASDASTEQQEEGQNQSSTEANSAADSVIPEQPEENQAAQNEEELIVNTENLRNEEAPPAEEILKEEPNSLPVDEDNNGQGDEQVEVKAEIESSDSQRAEESEMASSSEASGDGKAEQEITYVTMEEDGTTNTEKQAIQEDAAEPEPAAQSTEKATPVMEGASEVQATETSPDLEQPVADSPNPAEPETKDAPEEVVDQAQDEEKTERAKEDL